MSSVNSSKPLSFFPKIREPIKRVAQFVGNTRPLTLLEDRPTREKAHMAVMKDTLKAFKASSAMPSLLMNRVNPEASVCYKVETIYRDALRSVSFDSDFEALMKERSSLGRGKLEEGVQTFKYIQAYQLLKDFTRYDKGMEYLTYLINRESKKKEEKSSHIKENQQGNSPVESERSRQVRMIQKNISIYRDALKLLNKYHFLLKLSGGEAFLAGKGETHLQKLNYIKEHPQEITMWIENDPEVQAQKRLDLRKLNNFIVPEWINLLPNLYLNLSGARNIRFTVPEGSNLLPNLRVLNLSGRAHNIRFEAFNPQNLQMLCLTNAHSIRFGETFNPPDKTLILLKLYASNVEYIKFPPGAPKIRTLKEEKKM